MGIRTFKPVTPASRFHMIADFSVLSGAEPEKSLLAPMRKTGGRNSYGRVTAWQRGGGHKRRYRIIDFKRDKFDIPARVESIEYDPNRSAYIALLAYADGEKRYIIAPQNLAVGERIVSGDRVDVKPGNAMRIRNIPVGTLIHNLEMKEGKGGQLVRSAGNHAQLMAKEGDHAQVRMPSGEIRLVRLDCMATVGEVSNPQHEIVSIGKAGRSRWKGKRPQSRGVVMNPVDHPMGGGEGKTSGGRHPCTPWGKPTKGYKTRKNKATAKYIVKRRK